MLSALRRTRLVALVALALVCSTGGLFAGATPAAAWSAGTFGPASEQQVFALTNQARAAAGRAPLKWDNALLEIARWRSRDMAKRGYFSHQIPPNGTMVFDVMSSQGYCYTLAGENIGWNNYPDGQATTHIQQAWLKSSGHRENIMGKAWDAMAVGAYKLADGRHFWTVLFAARCATPKPTAKPKPKPTPRATATPTPKPPAARPATPAPATPTPATPAPATPAPSSPSAEPSVEPSAPPSAAPSAEPTTEPATETPTESTPGPVTEPTTEPSAEPTPQPSEEVAIVPAMSAPPAAASPAAAFGTPGVPGGDGGIALATSTPAESLRALAVYATRVGAGSSGTAAGAIGATGATTGDATAATGTAGVGATLGDPTLPGGVALPDGTSLLVNDPPQPPGPADDWFSGLFRFLFGG